MLIESAMRVTRMYATLLLGEDLQLTIEWIPSCPEGQPISKGYLSKTVGFPTTISLYCMDMLISS